MLKVVKVVAALLACSAVSIFLWVFGLGFAVSKSGFGIGVPKPWTWAESGGFLLALGFPFILFPLIAWLLRKDLGLFGSILFGLAPFALIVLLLFGFVIFDEAKLRKFRDDNPPTGERISYAPDGKITQILNLKNNKKNGINIEFCTDESPKVYGYFDNGVPVGIHLYRGSCSDSPMSLSEYGPSGEELEIKEMIDGHISRRTYIDTKYEGPGIRQITTEFQKGEKSLKWYLKAVGVEFKDNAHALATTSFRRTFYEKNVVRSEHSQTVKEVIETTFDERSVITSKTILIGGEGKTVVTFDKDGRPFWERRYDHHGTLINHRSF